MAPHIPGAREAGVGNKAALAARGRLRGLTVTGLSLLGTAARLAL